jgi:hypothetical protein
MDIGPVVCRREEDSATQGCGIGEDFVMKKKTLRERADAYALRRQEIREANGVNRIGLFEIDEAYIAGHRSRDREVRALRDLLRKAKEAANRDCDPGCGDIFCPRLDEDFL